MAFSRLVFSVLLVSVSCYASNVPVYLWGDLATTFKSNPMDWTTTPAFAKLFNEVSPPKSLNVIFTEQTLSPEDMSRRSQDGESSFPYLAKTVKSTAFSYLSAVDSPVQAIDESADPNEVVYATLTHNGLSIELNTLNAKYLFINLNDAKEGESRAEMLRRHNDFIEDTMGKLEETHKSVVGVLTALNPSWVITESHSRTRRQASNETEDYILEGVRLYVDLIELREGDNVLNLTSNNPSSSMMMNDTLNTMNTTVSFGDRSFVMSFKIKMGYWYFDSVIFNQGTATEEVLYPNTDRLYALLGFSYRCGQKTVFSNVFSNTSRALTFNDLQIQPYFTAINSSVQFGNTFDCVGFFSGAIWSGLLVTFILLAITFYGIMMMMDIKTMDRFDDPKGKTITINAE